MEKCVCDRCGADMETRAVRTYGGSDLDTVVVRQTEWADVCERCLDALELFMKAGD
jgi:hypothetical protein